MAESTVPTNTPTLQPAGGPIHGHQHRRAALTGVAAATALAAVPVAAQAAPDTRIAELMVIADELATMLGADDLDPAHDQMQVRRLRDGLAVLAGRAAA